jgi:hypothetical protein
MSIAKRGYELPKTNPLRKRIEQFLRLSYPDTNYSKVEYTGKSKKLKTKEVFILETKDDKVKVEDLEGNVTTVSEKMLNYIK